MATKIVAQAEVVASVVDDEIEEVEIVVPVYVLAQLKMVMANRYGNAVPKQPVERIVATIPTYYEVVIVA